MPNFRDRQDWDTIARMDAVAIRYFIAELEQERGWAEDETLRACHEFLTRALEPKETEPVPEPRRGRPRKYGTDAEREQARRTQVREAVARHRAKPL